MNIALIGATGFVGSAVLQELLQRGHRVTALARNPAKLAPREGLTVREADAKDGGAGEKGAALQDGFAVFGLCRHGGNLVERQGAFPCS